MLFDETVAPACQPNQPHGPSAGRFASRYVLSRAPRIVGSMAVTGPNRRSSATSPELSASAWRPLGPCFPSTRSGSEISSFSGAHADLDDQAVQNALKRFLDPARKSPTHWSSATVPGRVRLRRISQGPVHQRGSCRRDGDSLGAPVLKRGRCEAHYGRKARPPRDAFRVCAVPCGWKRSSKSAAFEEHGIAGAS